MGDPRRLLPHEVEILVARELRKAGLELASVKECGRTRLSAKGDDEYAVELGVVTRVDGAECRVLVECRNEGRPVRADAVRALHARLAEPADAPRRLMAAPSAPSAPP